MDKRIYSYNLSAFINLTTGILPQIRVDDNNPHLYYFVFPEKAEVSAAIQAYKQNECVVTLHKYLNAYWHIKQLVQEVRENAAK